MLAFSKEEVTAWLINYIFSNYAENKQKTPTDYKNAQKK